MTSTNQMTGNEYTYAPYMNFDIESNEHIYRLPDEDEYQPFCFNLFDHDYHSLTEFEEHPTIDPTALLLNNDLSFTHEDTFIPHQPTSQHYESWNTNIGTEFSPSYHYPIQNLSQNNGNLHEASIISVSSTNSSPSPLMSNDSASDHISFFNSDSEHEHSMHCRLPLPSQQVYLMSPDILNDPPYTSPFNPFENDDQIPSADYESDLPPPPSQPSPQQAANSARYRAERDEFIVSCRAQGMSYKEILRRGNFTCAESTLRGIHRAIILEREARPRKPIWKRLDEKLLLEAVEAMSSADRIARVLTTGTYEGMNMLGISWVAVGQYILENGGGNTGGGVHMKFGNTTCKKKWAALHGIDGPPERGRRRR